jgi:hypothetical protein
MFNPQKTVSKSVNYTEQEFISAGVDDIISVTTNVNNKGYQTLKFSNLPENYKINIKFYDTVPIGTLSKFDIEIFNAFGDKVTNFLDDFYLSNSGVSLSAIIPQGANQSNYLFNNFNNQSQIWKSISGTTFNANLFFSAEWSVLTGKTTDIIDSNASFIVAYIIGGIVLLAIVFALIYYIFKVRKQMKGMEFNEYANSNIPSLASL